MKRFKKIVVWLVLAAYLILISGFISEQRGGVLCNKLNIIIADSVSRRFIVPGDIVDLLGQKSNLPLGKPVLSIDVKRVENGILANTLIKDCEVYSTIDGKINIDVWQREPVVRIIDKRGKNYYLDNEGSVISPSKRFTPHLLVVNGNIHTPFKPISVENINNPKYNGKAERLRDIHQLALFISGNEFWNAQIEQIYVNNKGEFELIPRIGPHIIEFGKIDNYERKFSKLWTFYKEGLSHVGWNKYIHINLKYKDQIVCTKI